MIHWLMVWGETLFIENQGNLLQCAIAKEPFETEKTLRNFTVNVHLLKLYVECKLFNSKYETTVLSFYRYCAVNGPE